MKDKIKNVIQMSILIVCMAIFFAVLCCLGVKRIPAVIIASILTTAYIIYSALKEEE